MTVGGSELEPGTWNYMYKVKFDNGPASAESPILAERISPTVCLIRLSLTYIRETYCSDNASWSA